MSAPGTDHRTVDLASVDLTDLSLWADGPPYELFARMRREAPVHWNRSADGSGFWSVTRQAEITEVSTDPGTFSSARAGVLLRPDSVAPLEFMGNLPIFKDPPEHDLYRKIVAQAFLPRTMGMLDEAITGAIRQSLDAVLAGGDTGECDLVRDIAIPVPLLVLGRMLGSSDDDLEKLLIWTDELKVAVTHGGDASATFHQMAAHFMGLVNNQLIRGVDSLAKAVGEAEVDGRRLTEEEIAVYFGMLLYLGNEPTRGAIAGGLLALVQHPGQRELLRTKPALLKPSKAGLPPAALAEVMRWSAPVGHFARTATRQVTLGGQQIKENDRLIMWYPSANRDADAMAEPDVFDVQRSIHGIHQVSYGADDSPHRCQGAFLANKIVGSTLAATLTRLGDLELAGPVTWSGSTFANSLASVPVRFRPAVDPRPAVPEPRVYAGVAPAPTPSRVAAAPAASAPAAASDPAPATHTKPGFFARLFGKK